MSRIRWSTEVNAPCCPGEIVAVGRPRRDDSGRFEPNERILIETDWDYPGVAQSFGWSLRSVQKPGAHCDHDSTDGTVPCRECGLTQTDFISAAYDWLREHNAAEAEDPGYFGG
jgi:hypothetical protein